MKLRKIDYVTVFICALAAALCCAGSDFSSIVFIVSSSIGLIDSIKTKVLSAALINGIFLTMNLYMVIKTFF